MTAPSRDRDYWCAQCGAHKREANHWLVFTAKGGKIVSRMFDGWAENKAGVEHLCGRGCHSKRIEQALDIMTAQTATVKGSGVDNGGE